MTNPHAESVGISAVSGAPAIAEPDNGNIANRAIKWVEACLHAYHVDPPSQFLDIYGSQVNAPDCKSTRNGDIQEWGRSNLYRHPWLVRAGHTNGTGL